MSISSKKIFLKDRNGNYLLPISQSSLIQYNPATGGEETVKKSLDNINSYIGGLAGITDKINTRINTLDSDTDIGETVGNGGKEITADGKTSYIHTKNWLTYVGIIDGKIAYAEFTKATADNVEFSYIYTPSGTTDNPNPKPVNTTVSVSQRLTYLSDYADSLNKNIVDNANKTDKIVGLNKLYSGNGIELISSSNDSGQLESVTVNAKVDNLTTYFGADKSIKVKNVNAREVTVDAISNLSDTTQSLPAFLTNTYTKLYNSINDSKQSSYNNSDKAFNDVISRLGLIDGATDASKNTSYFTKTNSVKKITDALATDITNNRIDVYKDAQNNNVSGLTISDPQTENGKSGRTIKVNVDNDSVFLNSTNALSTKQYSLEYETTGKTEDNTNGTHLIKLYATNPVNNSKTLAGQIDATDFVKDSFLKTVSLTNAASGDDATNAILRMVWNTVFNDSYTDNEQDETTTIDVDLRNYIKPYKASNNGLSLDNQTFKLDISYGLTIGTKYNDKDDSTRRLYLNIDETSTDFNKSGKNNSSFVTLSASGLKISGIQKAINDAISKINAAETPLVKDSTNKISSPTKVITGITTTVSDNNTVSFTPSSVDLIANNVQYQYTTTGSDGMTTTVNESIGSYLDYLGYTVYDIKTRFGDTIIANLKSRISSWDEEQSYTGKIVSTIEETAGLVKATQYSFVDEFKLQTSLTPANKVKTGDDAHEDLHETLSTALSYLTSENTKQDVHLSNLDKQLTTTSDSVQYTAIKIPENKPGNDVFNTSSYLTVTPSTQGKTTTYTLELHDVASATKLNSINAELTSGNNTDVTQENKYTDSDHRTEGAIFFEQIGESSTIYINPSLFV